LPHAMRALLAGREETSLDLPAYGVEVLFEH
jgi:hypothetical protein